MTKREKRKFEEVKPEMTPMIDVTFLLLIFFIVTLKFKTLEGRLDAALPKDRGTSNTQLEDIEKVDIIIRVARPGQKVPDDDLGGKIEKYVNRVVNFEVGSQSYTDPEKLRQFLKPFDRKETPVSIDPRKGVIYEDVVSVLDVIVSEEFEKIAFAGSAEDE